MTDIEKLIDDFAERYAQAVSKRSRRTRLQGFAPAPPSPSSTRSKGMKMNREELIEGAARALYAAQDRADPFESLADLYAEGYYHDARVVLDFVEPVIRAGEIARRLSPDGEGEWRFKRGDCVRKIAGSKWHGFVVGFYSTELTPVGYAVESMYEIGSVQIYPEKAIELVSPTPPTIRGEKP